MSSVEDPSHWKLLHPTVSKIAKTRFDSGHYADAVEATLKEINDIVRSVVADETGEELDGSSLMEHAFSLKKPVIELDNLSTASGRDIQVGYMKIFAGAMTGVRNPKAHANVTITAERAIHFLFLASLLLYKLDERAKPLITEIRKPTPENSRNRSLAGRAAGEFASA